MFIRLRNSSWKKRVYLMDMRRSSDRLKSIFMDWSSLVLLITSLLGISWRRWSIVWVRRWISNIRNGIKYRLMIKWIYLNSISNSHSCCHLIPTWIAKLMKNNRMSRMKIWSTSSCISRSRRNRRNIKKEKTSWMSIRISSIISTRLIKILLISFLSWNIARQPKISTSRWTKKLTIIGTDLRLLLIIISCELSDYHIILLLI